MKVLHQFMKKKNTTPEDIQKMAQNAGIDMPLEVIKEKMERLEKNAEGEQQEHCRPGGHGFGPGAWFKIVAQFMKEKNVTPEEVADLAKQCGVDMPVDIIKTKMEFFKNMGEEMKKGEGYDWR